LGEPAITAALDAGVPLRDSQILARHADPRVTEHYDRAGETSTACDRATGPISGVGPASEAPRNRFCRLGGEG
jgi:hypothetical protein